MLSPNREILEPPCVIFRRASLAGILRIPVFAAGEIVGVGYTAGENRQENILLGSKQEVEGLW